jgi:hypothetical protein
MSEKTSVKYAIAAIDVILEEIHEKDQEVLQYVTIDKSLYDQGMNAITIDHTINNVNPNIIARTIRDIIKTAQEKQDTYWEKVKFVENFEEEMGERYFEELIKVGVNPGLIGMRFHKKF